MKINLISRLRKEKQRAHNKNNLKEVAIICNSLGAELVEAGEYEKALQEHREEASIFEALEDTIGVAVAHRRIGEVYSELQEWEKALHHQNKHLSLALKCGDPVEEQRAYATIGRTHMQQSEVAILEENKEMYNSALAKSEKALLKALGTCQKIGDKVDGKELAQMRCRVYHNLGLVVDLKGETLDAVKFVSQSLELCLQYDFTEDAYRSYSELARMHLKMEKLDKALEEARQSLKFGTKLQKQNFVADSHHLVAQIQLAKEDFLGARKSCYKAFKIKQPDKDTRTGIEKNLKLIVYIINAREELNRPEIDDEIRLKKLDKLGDNCATLGLYKQSVHFYEQRLNLALEKGKNGSYLAPIYTSLAQTYKDMKQYEKAYEYFNKELNIHLNINNKEAITTLIEIARISENLLQSYDKISYYFDQALEIAEKSSLHKYQGIVIKNYLTVSGVPLAKKESLEEQLVEIQSRFDDDFEFELSDIDDDDADGSDNEEIDLDYIEFSDSDDEENTRRQCSKRRTGVNSKDEKGESLLHKAVIRNDINLVKSLLDTKHPVNCRDYTGWLPIHDACSWGHLEVIELLIDAGAWINDQEGKECYGVSPLHDAAVNYHYDVVKLLVERGANIFAKDKPANDKLGKTPLDYLKEINVNDLSDENRILYHKTKTFLIERMTRAGYKVSDSLKISPKTNYERQSSRNISTGIIDYAKKTSDEELPNFEDNSDDESTYFPHFSSLNSQKNSATETYKSAMQSVRNHSRRSDENAKRCSESTKHPLVAEKDYVMDDFIIDDLETTKKRKRSLDKCEYEFKEKSRRSDNFESNETSFNSSNNIFTAKKKSRQPKLTSIFKKSSLNSSTNNLNNNVPNLDEEPEIIDETNIYCSQERNGNISLSIMGNSRGSSNMIGAPLCLQVRVLQNKITVPVAYTAQNNTIGWLAEEVSRRYFQLSGVKRILKLYTLKGEILNTDDVISEIFSTDNREIKATVTGTQDVDSMSEIYNKICRTLSATTYTDVSSKLKDCESLGGIDFSRLCLRNEEQFKPLLTSMQFQNNIQYLNFNSCRLGDAGMTDMIRSLSSFPLVVRLEAEACNITANSFVNLLNVLVEDNFTLIKISSFNLSYNDFSKVNFSTFLKFLSLSFVSELKLVACGMSFQMGAEKIVSKVSSLYLDENQISIKSLSTVTSSCPFLTHFSIRESISGVRDLNDISIGTALSSILGAGDHCLLQHLDISLCNVTSADLDIISSYLFRCPYITCLNLSENLYISSDSVLTLLKELSACLHCSLNTLSIHGICSLESNSTFSLNLMDFIEKKANSSSPFVSLSLSNSVSNDDIKKLWSKIYGEKSLVKSISKVLFLKAEL